MRAGREGAATQAGALHEERGATARRRHQQVPRSAQERLAQSAHASRPARLSHAVELVPAAAPGHAAQSCAQAAPVCGRVPREH